MKSHRRFAHTSIVLVILCLALLSTGCSRVPEEKIAQAQEVYSQLADVHNQVVNAHKQINSDTYDTELSALADKIVQVESYNLYEMSEEDIDLLINAMNTIIDSYQDYLNAIETTRSEEEAAVLTPLPITLVNDTTFSFIHLTLYEKGCTELSQNLLENTAGLSPSQTLTGLIIDRDAKNTPWLLDLEDSEGNTYQLTISVENLSEEGTLLTLSYDSEQEELIYS